jgi:hypothetical protein
MEPEFPDGERGLMLNATAIIELARETDSIHCKAFLQAYHESEADIAAISPWLSEAAIRGKAVIQAFHLVGPPRI